MFVVGVDGCRAGWLVVGLVRGGFSGATLLPSFASVLESTRDADAVAVDMPIGLVDGGRLCDQLAKERLGARASTIFAMPPRAALEADSYEEANARSRTLIGHGLSRQAYALRARVLEVEAALAAERPLRSSVPPPSEAPRRARVLADTHASLRRYARVIEGGTESGPYDAGALERIRFPGGRVIESHPELSFAAMQGCPVPFPKRTADGAAVRLRLLADHGIHLPSELPAIRGGTIDDLLDAAAVAWSAHRYVRGQAESLPERARWQLAGGHVVAIWF